VLVAAGALAVSLPAFRRYQPAPPPSGTAAATGQSSG
jgi:hypothetical protein